MEDRFCHKCRRKQEVHIESKERTKFYCGAAITYTNFYAVCPDCGEYLYQNDQGNFDKALREKKQIINQNRNRKVVKETIMFCERCGKTHNVKTVTENDWFKFGDISCVYEKEMQYCTEKKCFYETDEQEEKNEEARCTAYQGKMERMEKENRIEVIGEETMYCDCCGYTHNVKRVKMRDWDECEGTFFEYTAEHLYCDEEDLYYDTDWSPDELYAKNEEAKAAACFMKKNRNEN